MDRLPQLLALSHPSPTPASANAQPSSLFFSPRENLDDDSPTPLGTSTQSSTARVQFHLPVREIDAHTAEGLDAFYSDVDAIIDLVEVVESSVRELQAKHQLNIQTLDISKSITLRQSIDQLSDRINQAAKELKERLGKMKAGVETMREQPEVAQANSAVIRIQDNYSNYLVLLVTNAMGAYQRQQQSNEKAYRQQTERQIKINYSNSDGTAMDDETVHLLAEQVMENRLNSYVFQQSKDVLASIVETRNDIYRIEQSMRDLNQMFNDLAFMVHEQGEVMDIILENVRASERYLESGINELTKARSYQKKSRKKMFCIIGIVVIIILLFVFAGVLGKIIPK